MSETQLREAPVTDSTEAGENEKPNLLLEGAKKSVESIKKYAAEHPFATARLVTEISVAVGISLTNPDLLSHYADPNNPTWIVSLAGFGSDVLVGISGLVAGSFKPGNEFTKNVIRNFGESYKLSASENAALKKLHPDWLNEKGEFKGGVDVGYMALKFIFRNMIVQHLILPATLQVMPHVMNTPQFGVDTITNIQNSIPGALQSGSEFFSNLQENAAIKGAEIAANIQETVSTTEFRDSVFHGIRTVLIGVGFGAGAAGLVYTGRKLYEGGTYVGQKLGEQWDKATQGVSNAYNSVVETGQQAVATTKEALTPAYQTSMEFITSMNAKKDAAVAEGKRRAILFLGGELRTENFETELLLHKGELSKNDVETAPINGYLKEYLRNKLGLKTKENAKFELSDVLLDLLLVAMNLYDYSSFNQTIDIDQATEVLKWVYEDDGMSNLLRLLTDTQQGEELLVDDDLQAAVNRYNKLYQQLISSKTKRDSAMYRDFHKAQEKFPHGYYPPPDEDEKPDL